MLLVSLQLCVPGIWAAIDCTIFDEGSPSLQQSEGDQSEEEDNVQNAVCGALPT